MAFPRKFTKLLAIAILVIFTEITFLGIAQNSTSYSSNPVLTGGRIFVNTTWTLTNSPYVITSDVVVDSGTILTIDPGVAIRFDGNFSITVYGTLQAVGAVSNPIVFTSNKPQSNAGDWNTIIFIGASNESFTIKNTIIKYARNGITIQSLGKATIENSEIANNLASGIRVVGKSNLALKENIIEFNGNGVSSNGEKVSGIKMVGNSIRFNENGTYFQAWATQAAAISNVTISRNTVNFNRKGIYFYIWASFYDYDMSLIYNVLISENLVSSNYEYGILLYSGGPWYGSIYDVAISHNKIFSNPIGVYLSANAHHLSTAYDVLLSKNTVSANGKGISVFGGIKSEVEPGVGTNFTQNSISYNGYGVLYEGHTDNVAHFNDVYYNTYGMNVTNGATVNAENNYWGDIDGPNHPSNPEGKGNPVNGNGFDLDFMPFLINPTVNKPPVAVLDANKTVVAVNEIIMFNASRSSDDGRIKAYLFDFGDGANSNWVIEPSATHAYASTGSYVASLSVVDDLGFESNNTATLTLTVQPTLTVTISVNAETVHSDENLIVNVHATDGLNPVPEVNITLYSNNGIFFPKTGKTNSTGDFITNYTIPSVTERKVIVIKANATKEGYWSGQGHRQVTVFPKAAASWLEFIWIILAMAASLALIIVFAAKKKTPKEH